MPRARLIELLENAIRAESWPECLACIHAALDEANREKADGRMGSAEQWNKSDSSGRDFNAEESEDAAR